MTGIVAALAWWQSCFSEPRGRAWGHRTNEEVARNGRPSLQVVMVAGARNQRYLQLWSGAA